MITIIDYANLTAEIISLILAFVGLFLCVEIMNKSSGKLKKAVVYFLISLISLALYSTGEIFNMESLFSLGKLTIIIFNILTAIFLLFGLMMLNKLINELRKGSQKKGEYRKEKHRIAVKKKEYENIIKKMNELEKKAEQKKKELK